MEVWKTLARTVIRGTVSSAVIAISLAGLSPSFADDAQSTQPEAAELRPLPETLAPQPGNWPDSDQPVDFFDNPPFRVGYDHGFAITPTDPAETPFSLKFNLQNQIRYVGFARGVDSWTDSAQNVFPVTNRNNLELPRGHAIFSGIALLPELGYYLNIDYNTVSTRQVNFRGFWLGYEISPAATVYIGQDKVPGSREWLTSAYSTLGPDRTLATTFFRPSLSQGVWVIGEVFDELHYRAMIANGFNTGSVSPQQLDSRFAYAASTWWEPLGEFGPAESDLECHDAPAIRLGASYTIAPVQGQQGDPNFPENNDIRLSDGTLITTTGALAPNVTVQTFGIMLGSIDFGFKYKGFSFTSEFFMREIFNMHANGALPRTSMFDLGGLGQFGVFAIPQKFEVYARTSQVIGPFGTGGEYAGGCNWFVLPGRQDLRFTLDVAWINHSPAEQNRTDYRAGDTGLLIRSQIQTLF
jgi:hypothetical protein